jgi:RHS repeat-associated protein
MVASQTQNGVTNTFQLDATGRQRQREQAGGVAGIEIFHYDGPGDSTSWTSLGSTWSRNVPGIGGELAAVQESSGGTTTTTFRLTDLHGDAIASASSSPTALKLLATARFTEFGEPVSGTAGRFGWLGGKSRRTELQSGVIQMGARSYIPQLGRFLTPDPVRGGSANAYDYANQDPVNLFDLDGQCPKNNPNDTCHKGSKNGSQAETAGEHRKFNARERRAIARASRQLAREKTVRLDIRAVNKTVAEVKKIVEEHYAANSQSGLESLLSSIGAKVVSVLPDCAQVGAALDGASFLTGSVAIGFSVVPGGQGVAGGLGLASGGTGLAAVPFDVEGKEGNC